MRPAASSHALTAVAFVCCAAFTTAVGAQQGGSGDVVLPNNHGQIWKVYDIRPYTSNVKTDEPQRAVVDWVLRETGTESWFGETLAILNATPEQLRVYHTPEVQRTVEQVVQRMKRSRARTNFLSVRLATINNPNWRTHALRMLKPVPAEAPGVDAWLLSKEDASQLIGELSRRLDYREHNSPSLQIQNGQSQTISKRRPRSYVRSIQRREGSLLGPELVRAQIDEGFTLQISPLLSLDENTIDAVVKCHIDQVERLLPVSLEVPGPDGQMQQLQIEVPQLVSWRLHERFRWPSDQVLLLSCGVVAQPGPARKGMMGPLSGLLGQPTDRADALLFIEATAVGKEDAALRAAAAPNYNRRY